mmetsp:Transcript_46354/g.150784  ORF Transcript_46354/g.150784 Transcript_46354/m.150784 type:complete len:376 (-) Transcript_46354:36-1163(-)
MIATAGGTGSGAGGSCRAARNSTSSCGSIGWPERAQCVLYLLGGKWRSHPTKTAANDLTRPRHGSRGKLASAIGRQQCDWPRHASSTTLFVSSRWQAGSAAREPLGCRTGAPYEAKDTCLTHVPPLHSTASAPPCGTTCTDSRNRSAAADLAAGRSRGEALAAAYLALAASLASLLPPLASATVFALATRSRSRSDGAPRSRSLPAWLAFRRPCLLPLCLGRVSPWPPCSAARAPPISFATITSFLHFLGRFHQGGGGGSVVSCVEAVAAVGDGSEPAARLGRCGPPDGLSKGGGGADDQPGEGVASHAERSAACSEAATSSAAATSVMTRAAVQDRTARTGANEDCCSTVALLLDGPFSRLVRSLARGAIETRF